MRRMIDLNALLAYPLRRATCDKEHADPHFIAGVESVMEYAESLPVVDAKPVVHGRWIGEGDGYWNGSIIYDVWNCSECGYTIDDGTDDPDELPHYCPDCGAMMEV